MKSINDLFDEILKMHEKMHLIMHSLKQKKNYLFFLLEKF